MVARYDSQNVSSASLFITEDFPTEVSPTRTILYMKSDIWEVKIDYQYINSQTVSIQHIQHHFIFNNIRFLIFLFAHSLLTYNLLFNKELKSKNMDSTIPVSANAPRGAPMPVMGQQPYMPMGNMPMGNMPMGNMPMGNIQMGSIPMGAARPGYYQNLYMNPIETNQKLNEFSKGIYVSGFEKTLTAAMLQEHFKIKPIAGLKLPMSKFGQNKGFAFVYYQNPDDVSYVKEKLDHSVILRNKIRVTKTVVSENLSKMMFKLKKTGLSQEQIKVAKERYFSQKNLEFEVTKIIQPIFANTVQVNKIIIPHSKTNASQFLDYARGFFYVSNLKEATKIVKNQTSQAVQDNIKRQSYELVLGFIAEKLNSHPEFSKYIKAEIYQYAKKNQSNVLHIKNINAKPDEDPSKIAEQLKAFIQDQRKQANIKGCYVGIFGKLGAWANVIFSTYQETLDAYEHFKENRVKFRDNLIYANLRNVKDLRTVVISTVQKQVTEPDMRSFLNKLAESSNRVDGENEAKGRKYDFVSFNIIEQKTFYIDNQYNSVGLTEEEKPGQSWRENNTVPRRVVVHFLNQVTESALRNLLVDIKLIPGWDKIFFEKDAKAQNTIRANHQKGHIKDSQYVRHTELNRKKPENQMQPKEKQNRPRPDGTHRRPPAEGGQYGGFRTNKPPGVPRGTTGHNKNMMPAAHRSQFPNTNRPMGQMGAMPGYGAPMSKMGTVPTPISIPIGGMGKPVMPSMGGSMPPMGMPSMGMPPMGGSMPPMGGSMPPMGGSMPPMGGSMPPMGMPPMGMSSQQMGGIQVPKMGNPPMPQDKKQ